MPEKQLVSNGGHEVGTRGWLIYQCEQISAQYKYDKNDAAAYLLFVIQTYVSR